MTGMRITALSLTGEKKLRETLNWSFLKIAGKLYTISQFENPYRIVIITKPHIGFIEYSQMKKAIEPNFKNEGLTSKDYRIEEER